MYFLIMYISLAYARYIKRKKLFLNNFSPHTVNVHNLLNIALIKHNTVKISDEISINIYTKVQTDWSTLAYVKCVYFKHACSEPQDMTQYILLTSVGI